MRRPNPALSRGPVPEGPAPLLETGVHLQVAAYLHAAFPGGNPRCIVKAQPARKAYGGLPALPAKPALYEPPHPWARWWHTPNQGRRSEREGAQFVAMGMRAGVSDLGFMFRLPLDGRGLFFCQPGWLELKRENGKGRLSDEQKRWRDDCESVGAWWGQAKTVGEAHEWLTEKLEGFGLAPSPTLLKWGGWR